MNLTNSQEEYLKTIYILKNTINEIRVTDIAEKLNKSKASVNTAINTLKQSGFINYEPYGKIELTTYGEKEATKIIEAYDIVKLFLSDIIEVKSENIEKEAKEIKTILSDDSLNKLAKYTHKTLGLHSLECGYDINKTKCIKCAKRTKK
ncbi:MAG: metal-dependent transcriptional regulator [Clostridia bacterium]|nr:metal-dependent transcriptional regulator [Clostridia bacterium]